jgi:hypothetical protein
MNSQLPVQYEDYDLPEDYEILDEAQIPVPEWHLKIIRERLAKYEAEGFVGRTWAEFEPELIKFEQKLIEELKKK